MGNRLPGLRKQTDAKMATLLSGLRPILRRRTFQLAFLAVALGLATAYAAAAAHSHPPSNSDDTSVDTSTRAQQHAAPTAQVMTSMGNSTQSTEDSSHDTVSVTLNGRPLHVPADGDYHKEVSDAHGSTSVDISHQSSGSNSSSSLTIELQSNSTSRAGGNQSD